ncbi:MAG: hypothetical protein AAB477_00970 [Patescibacteria group bacterium]
MTISEINYLDGLELFRDEFKKYIISLLKRNFQDIWPEKFRESLNSDQQKNWDSSIKKGLSPKDVIDFHYLKSFAIKYKNLLEPQFGKKTNSLPTWFDEIAYVRHHLTHFTQNYLKESDVIKGWIHMIYIAQILQMSELEKKLEIIQKREDIKKKFEQIQERQEINDMADEVPEAKDNKNKEAKPTPEKKETVEEKTDKKEEKRKEMKKEKVVGLSEEKMKEVLEHTKSMMEKWNAEKAQDDIERQKEKIEKEQDDTERQKELAEIKAGKEKLAELMKLREKLVAEEESKKKAVATEKADNNKPISN